MRSKQCSGWPVLIIIVTNDRSEIDFKSCSSSLSPPKPSKETKKNIFLIKKIVFSCCSKSFYSTIVTFYLLSFVFVRIFFHEVIETDVLSSFFSKVRDPEVNYAKSRKERKFFEQTKYIFLQKLSHSLSSRTFLNSKYRWCKTTFLSLILFLRWKMENLSVLLLLLFCCWYFFGNKNQMKKLFSASATMSRCTWTCWPRRRKGTSGTRRSRRQWRSRRCTRWCRRRGWERERATTTMLAPSAKKCF